MFKDGNIHAFPSTIEQFCHGMDTRTYAAIALRVPDSGLDWLDDMIRKAKRDDFAGQALVGILSGRFWEITKIKDCPEAEAYRIADTMMNVKDYGK